MKWVSTLLVYGLQSHTSPKLLADQEMMKKWLQTEEKAAGWVSKHCVLTGAVEQVPARGAFAESGSRPCGRKRIVKVCRETYLQQPSLSGGKIKSGKISWC